MTTTRITGREAIEYAEEHGLLLAKHADPTEDARTGLSVREAEDIADEDPGLIYLDLSRLDRCETPAEPEGALWRRRGPSLR